MGDIVTNVCHEVHTEVQLGHRVINHPRIIAPVVPVVQTAGVVAPIAPLAPLAPATAVGPLVGALGLNPALIHQPVVKREADAEADPQLFLTGLAGGLAGPVLTGPVSPVVAE